MNNPTTQRGKFLDHVINNLKNEKISLGVLASVVALAFWALGWADDHYVQKDQFNTLEGLLVTHIEEARIQDAAQIVRDLELQYQIATATETPANELERMQTEITEAKAYRRCLIEQRPNCHHLRPAQ